VSDEIVQADPREIGHQSEGIDDRSVDSDGPTSPGSAAVGLDRYHSFRAMVALVPGALFVAVFVWRASDNPYGSRRFTLFDDAMISMTYGRTLAEHGELVWFEGAERVQGITNPLWTLFMAAIHWIGLSDSSAALAVSIAGVGLVLASGLLVSAIVSRSLDSRSESQAFAYLAGGAVPFLYPFVFWALRGMEVGLLAVAALTMIWSAPEFGPVPGWLAGHRRILVCASAGVVGVLTRIDFVVLAIVIGAVASLANDGWRQRAHRFAAVSGSAIGAVLFVLALQRVYYGDWLPNTYYLKIEGFSVIQRTTRGVVSAGKTGSLLIAVVLSAWFLVRSKTVSAMSLTVAAAGGTFVAAVAYSIWVGGDAWESFLMTSRYVSVALPAAVIVVAVAASRITAATPASMIRRWLGLVAVAAIGAGLVSNPYRFHAGFALFMVVIATLSVGAFVWVLAGSRRVGGEWSVATITMVGFVLLSGAYPLASWTSTGGLHVDDDQRETQETIALLASVSDEAVVATNWAGAPGYYGRRRMIDLLGKTDERIARLEPIGELYPGHNKRDYDYSIGELRPDVVLRVWAPGSSVALRLEEWGYVLRCVNLPSGQAVSANYLAVSSAVNWSELTDCA